MSDVALKTEECYKIHVEDFTIFARKMFMTTKIDDTTGEVIPCTVLEIEPNVVVGVRNAENSLVLKMSGIHDKGGSDKSIINRIGKPSFGMFKSVGVAPMRALTEVFVNLKEDSNKDSFVVGQKIFADIFQGVSFVDVASTSKGKGFQGVMKLHGMAGGPASHGSSRFHRGRGSVGARSTPGRTFPHTKMASRMGGDKLVVENLRVLDILSSDDLGIDCKVPGTKWIIVRGSVAGSTSSIVKIRSSRKMAHVDEIKSGQ
ncbi:MAG: 50S ribosomal protein L3 [Chlamydiia bacterium]|nr:50S ribosomal protein L3 [Chlamydiia bacterium]